MRTLESLADEFHTDKAISIRQPWADLIVWGDKDIENRGWYTSYRGPIFIHASRTFDHQAYQWIVRRFGHVFTSKMRFDRGGLIGVATLTFVYTEHSSKWFQGKYGFYLEDPQPIEFHPLKGQVGVFNIFFPEVNPFQRHRQGW